MTVTPEETRLDRQMRIMAKVDRVFSKITLGMVLVWLIATVDLLSK